MKQKKRHRPAPIQMRRILNEVSTRTSKNKRYSVRLKLSEAFENVPMTIDQDEIWVIAEFSGGELVLTTYCDELISPDGLEGGVYIDEEESNS